MMQIVHAMLVLPDGRLAFQRRTKDAKVGPDALGFFGGHMEEGETPLQAIKRELKEETSLKVDKLMIEPISSYMIKKDILDMPEDGMFHLFAIQIPDANFKVYEGQRTEVYSKKEALARDDIFESVKIDLTKAKEAN